MFTAAVPKEGVVIRIEGQMYRVLEAESKTGTAKLGGVVKTKLSNGRNGHVWEWCRGVVGYRMAARFVAEHWLQTVAGRNSLLMVSDSEMLKADPVRSRHDKSAYHQLCGRWVFFLFKLSQPGAHPASCSQFGCTFRRHDF